MRTTFSTLPFTPTTSGEPGSSTRGVFGWRFEDWGPPDFYRVHTGTPEDTGIAGALQKRQTQLSNRGSTGFTCTISVADIDGTKRSVEKHGGTISYSGEIPTVGKLVYFEDPEGNILGAMQYEPQALENIRRGL